MKILSCRRILLILCALPSSLGDELGTVIGNQVNSLSADSKHSSAENVTAKALREARSRQLISDGFKIHSETEIILSHRHHGQSEYNINVGGKDRDTSRKKDKSTSPKGDELVVLLRKDDFDQLHQTGNVSERKLTNAHELFVTPILDWNIEQWLFFLFLLVLLSFVARIMRRIRCCGCDLMDCLACWCCYEVFFDPTPGYELC
uniref:Uncharacterized protein n=1 Tax=Chaetoceros debilis TaxID=122233 RepID=A0A7S3PUS8_9STRA|mmetsp:Transcript_26333/g.40243  ORF Transcript_26333/g.40243 Transcript_26333/m.40243 type:complete len:204 (+) Transcript_26333:118-729(+)